MSAISNLARRRVLGALTAAGIAAITFTSMVAAPGAALAATPSSQTYKLLEVADVGTAKIYLWTELSAPYAHHGEILDAAPGDRVQLQWDDGSSSGKHVGAIIGVPGDANYANTSDVAFLGQFRTCGWAGTAMHCTNWI
jgi:hypothetical protein